MAKAGLGGNEQPCLLLPANIADADASNMAPQAVFSVSWAVAQLRCMTGSTVTTFSFAATGHSELIT